MEYPELSFAFETKSKRLPVSGTSVCREYKTSGNGFLCMSYRSVYNSIIERMNMSQKSYFPQILICAVFVFSISACASPEPPAPTLDVNEIVQQVAATLEMGYTQTAQAIPTATNTPEPTITPVPSATSEPLTIATPTLTFTPTLSGPTPLPINPATANGCYNAALVADVTVPVGTSFKAGDSFKKTWRLINTGTCDWTGEFKITYAGGDLFGSDTTKIRQRVGVGGIADISLDMVTPSGASGTVVSYWQMATDAGSLFGPVLTVSIILPGSNPTATSIGCYNATLVSDVTIPSGTRLNPGEAFTKTWQIKNSGTCDWTSDYKITYVGGDLFGSDTTKIRKRVLAGSTIEFSLDMVAPSTSGSATSSWQMADDSGFLFGQVYTIQIVVK